MYQIRIHLIEDIRIKIKKGERERIRKRVKKDRQGDRKIDEIICFKEREKDRHNREIERGRK